MLKVSFYFQGLECTKQEETWALIFVLEPNEDYLKQNLLIQETDTESPVFNSSQNLTRRS